MTRTDHVFNGKDGEFHYIDWGGSGPPAHFSHATGLCAGTYTPLAEILGRDLNLFGMDDRGHGRTRAAADPGKLHNWDIFADDLERFIEHLGKPVVAMGHSRGGVASLLLAVKRPDLVRALILIDPTIIPFSWGWWWSLSKKIGQAKRIPIAATAARRKNGWPSQEAVLDSYRKKAVFQSWTDGFLEAYIADGTQATAHGQVELCCNPAWESRCFATCPHDIWKLVPQLSIPTLVLYGNNSDTFLTSAVKRFEAKMPHAKLVGFENTGHFVPMEQPQETRKAIVDFLKEHKIIG